MDADAPRSRDSSTNKQSHLKGEALALTQDIHQKKFICVHLRASAVSRQECGGPNFRNEHDGLDGGEGSGDGGDVGGGRTGFDLGNAPEAACRGWFVGLVKNRTKNQKLIKN